MTVFSFYFINVIYCNDSHQRVILLPGEHLLMAGDIYDCQSGAGGEEGTGITCRG